MSEYGKAAASSVSSHVRRSDEGRGRAATKDGRGRAMRSQKLGHVHEVVHAERGVAPLCPDAWRSIEGYVRPYARDCCASVLSVCA